MQYNIRLLEAVRTQRCTIIEREKYLENENQGPLRSGNKSDILEWLKAPTGRSAEAKAATVVVLYMAVVVHMVWPTSAYTFRDYVSQHLVQFVESQVTPTHIG